jgi:tetratricopeptide (TPR) repeat protein/predicted Ser/Thr protein kinase/TolB-like protein
MERRHVRRPDDQPATKAEGTAAVKSPSDVGSSPASDTFPSESSPTRLELVSDAPTIAEGTFAASAGTSHTSDSNNQTLLRPGTVLGRRYEILQILGEGGMGAVYRARDREVNRMVALKVIRPELTGNSAMLDRFKQELVLSHQVTHKNVVRIYDMGDADGIKFITMEYIEGQDLRSLIAQQKVFQPEEAVEMMRQVCRALEAAHAVGVIHRDLKPQNIMRDKQGRVVVMDFGLARLLDSHDGMTQTGAIVGTLEYMSPEQGLGMPLDERSDLFAVGLIFYELLTGQMPYKADSALASLVKRTRERAVPVSERSASIPHALSDIVSKCLEPKLLDRYQHVGEILTDLEAWQGGRAAATLKFPSSSRPWGQTMPWHWIGGVAAVLVLAIVGFLLRDKLFRPTTARAPSGPVVSLAILPFRNASGDPGLDWLGSSLADMLSTDVGQSAQLRTISPDRLHQVLTDLQITANVVIDPTMLRRIAEFSGADTVVWGQYAKFGDQIRIDASLQDLKHDRRIPLKIEVPSEKDVPGGVDRLAESLRQNIGVSGDVVKELRASSFQPTSQSLPALRDYNEGVKLLRDGKSVDAQKQLEAATKEDPTFALAFSKLAQTYANLGYDSQAEQSARKAVGLSENLPPPEKYLITAILAQVVNNYSDAIKAYENMAKASPGNADVQSTLGRLYENTGDFAKAYEDYQKVLKANPKDITAIVSTGRLAIKRGNPQDSLDPLNRALSLSIQLGNDEERSTSLHLMGVAYRMLNKPEDALRNFQQALAIRRSTDEKRGIAFSLNEMAVVESSLGKSKDALAHYQEALQVRREIGDKRGLGDTLLDLGNFYDDGGDHDRALKMYKEALQLERDIGNEGLQAICLNNIGAVYFEKNEYEDARTYYQQAIQLREKSKVPQDIVESVHNLAETLARMGQYDQAITQYMRALELQRSMNDARGAAIESYSIGTLFDYQGRFGAAINSKQDALKTFRNLKDRTFWMAEILGGYAEALTLAGRGQESQAYLDEALSLSRELKNDGMVAQTLDFEGDFAYYSGDLKSARSYYQSALQAAAHTKEPDKALTAKADLARVDIEEGHTAVAIGTLRSLAQQAEEQGFAYMDVECSIYMAEAMMQARDYSHARAELERALLEADKLGLKPLSTKAHYVLGTVLRQSGNPADAQDHYRNSAQLIDTMRKEPGAEKILQRSDFKAIYDAASRWSQAAKN